MLTYRQISFTVSNFSDISEIIPFLIWAVWGAKNRPYRTLGLFFLLSGIIKLGTLITAIMYVHNMPAYHLLAFLEIAFVWSYYRQLKGKKPPYIGLFFVLLLFWANIFLQNINTTFNSNTWTFTVLVILALGLNHFKDIYQNDIISPLSRQPEFFITAGWLIYAGGSLFSYLMGTDILSGHADGFFQNAWIFQCFANIIKNGLVAYGLLLSGKICLK